MRSQGDKAHFLFDEFRDSDLGAMALGRVCRGTIRVGDQFTKLYRLIFEKGPDGFFTEGVLIPERNRHITLRIDQIVLFGQLSDSAEAGHGVAWGLSGSGLELLQEWDMLAVAASPQR